MRFPSSCRRSASDSGFWRRGYGGGAAQILFSIFGEIVFNRGPAGIGIVWGCAGIGLLIGGVVGHRLGERLSFDGYKRAVVVCYVIHGGAYVLFSQMRNFH